MSDDRRRDCTAALPTPTSRNMGLTLGRTPGDSIVLRTPSGKTIATITINDIEVMASGATTARVEIEAPRQVEILRGELINPVQ